MHGCTFASSICSFAIAKSSHSMDACAFCSSISSFGRANSSHSMDICSSCSSISLFTAPGDGFRSRFISKNSSRTYLEVLFQGKVEKCRRLRKSYDMNMTVKACTSSIADRDSQAVSVDIDEGIPQIDPRIKLGQAREKLWIRQSKTNSTTSKDIWISSSYQRETGTLVGSHRQEKSVKVSIEDEIIQRDADAFALKVSHGSSASKKRGRSLSLDGRQNAKVYDIESPTSIIIHQEENSEQEDEQLTTRLIDMRKNNDNETFLRRLLVQRKEADRDTMDMKPADNPDVFNANADNLDKERAILRDIESNPKLQKDMIAFQRSLALKRENVAKVLQDAMQASKLGPKYSKQVIDSMPLFVDRVLMKAVALKRRPKYATLPFNSRARLIIDRSKVVDLIKWLKHNHVTVPRVGFLVCHAGDQLEIIRPKVEWLKSIYVRGRDLGVVLSREPSILEQSDEELNNIVSFLENSGIKKDWMGWIVGRTPRVLGWNTDELHEKVSFLLDLGMEKGEFGAMIFKFPPLLGRYSKEEMQEKVDYLRKFGLECPTLGKVIADKPQLMTCSIEEAWEPITKFFYYLGVDRAGIRRILIVKPSVFCLNLAENIAPKVRFFRAIGVREQEIGRLIVDFPTVLTYSLDKKIRPVVRFLLERVGVPEEKIGKVVAVEPKLISCNLPLKLEVAVKYLISRGIRTHQLGEMVSDFPMLLKYSKEVLTPKYQYFRRSMQLPLEELIAFPRYFSYALETRIIPRHKILKKKGLRFNLRYMLSCSDSEFQKRVELAEIKADMAYTESYSAAEAHTVSYSAAEANTESSSEENCSNL